ncbi:MAG: hypothetical protein MZU91_15200 [Desulfosudis oleivorans]|nr:hypothetical protein [Desulfosudis oleivorans]
MPASTTRRAGFRVERPQQRGKRKSSRDCPVTGSSSFSSTGPSSRRNPWGSSICSSPATPTGGRSFPFNHIVRLYFPTESGLHDLGHSHVYVSRGSGTWGPPIRFLAPPEVTVIELVRRKPGGNKGGATGG